MEIRKLNNQEVPEAMKLAWEVFQEFEAPDYPAEGIRTFKAFLDEQEKNLSIEIFGAFEEDLLVGIIATRSQGSHIALFFVKKEFHRQGIGRKLFEHIAPLCNNHFITVNSSPYAAPVYRKLGFLDTDGEQLTDGLRYIPMKYSS